LQDFFFEGVVVGIIRVLGVAYLCFAGACWVSVFSIFLNPVLNYFVGGNGFHPLFVFPSLYLVLCKNVVDRLLVVSVTCLLCLGLILFCEFIGVLA
jgi:hypothetical protein